MEGRAGPARNRLTAGLRAKLKLELRAGVGEEWEEDAVDDFVDEGGVEGAAGLELALDHGFGEVVDEFDGGGFGEEVVFDGTFEDGFEGGEFFGVDVLLEGFV